MVSILICPWVLLLWLCTGPWLCFSAVETPAESWLPVDRIYSWTHGWMEAHPIKSTEADTGSGKVCRHLLSSSDIVVCVWLRALTSYWLMRVKSKQPGEVWINRRNWQTDSSIRLQTAPDRRLFSQSSFLNADLCMWVCIKDSSPYLHHEGVMSVFQTRASTFPLETWRSQNVNVICLKQCDNPQRKSSYWLQLFWNTWSRRLLSLRKKEL